MSKHANRGALPAMLVLGVLIGASLAVASPSRPNGAPPSASPPVVASPGASGDEGGAAGSGGAGERHDCAQAITALAHGDHGLSHAIARVLAKCKENPQAPGLVNALLHRSGTPGNGGGEASDAGGASELDEGGSAEGGSDEGGSDEGGSDEGGSDEGGTDEGGTAADTHDNNG